MIDSFDWQLWLTATLSEVVLERGDVTLTFHNRHESVFFFVSVVCLFVCGSR